MVDFNMETALRSCDSGILERHKFGIFSGLNSEKGDPLDNEHPWLPANLQKVFDSGSSLFGPTIFPDFEVCPLEPHITGHMQAACIESATHIVVRSSRVPGAPHIDSCVGHRPQEDHSSPPENYSVITRSAHSTSDTKIVGLPNFAP